MGLQAVGAYIFLEFGRVTNLVYGQALKTSGDALFPVILGAIFMYLFAVGGTYFLGIHMGLLAVGSYIAMAGEPKMARAVGNALHKNPDPEHIPCFRVVNAKGELAGAFAFGGEQVQAQLLEEDGVEVVDGKVDLDKYGIQINP